MQLDADVDEQCSALWTLTDKLSPEDRRRLLQVSAASVDLIISARRCKPCNRRSFLPQDVFNQSFDSALQSLLSDFLSRIEQMFPVPDFMQVLS